MAWCGLLDKYDPTSPHDDFVAVSGEFLMPQISFTVRGHGGNRGSRNEREAWRRYPVDASFGFKTNGMVTSPVGCTGQPGSFLLNSLGSHDCVEQYEEGFLGDGWLEDGDFLLRVYVDSSAARDFVYHLRDFSECDAEETEDGRKFRVRFDLMCFREFNVAGRSRLAYRIVRIYS